jgi:hypothetical protein
MLLSEALYERIPQLDALELVHAVMLPFTLLFPLPETAKRLSP